MPLPVNSILSAISGRVVETSDSNSSPGSALLQRASSGAAHQRWRFVVCCAPDAEWMQLAVSTNGAVATADPSGGTPPFPVSIQPWTNDHAQMWKAEPVAGGRVVLRNRGSTAVLAVPEGQEFGEGATLQAEAEVAGALRQQWFLVELP
jgi:hypothetical protein